MHFFKNVQITDKVKNYKESNEKLDVYSYLQIKLFSNFKLSMK